MFKRNNETQPLTSEVAFLYFKFFSIFIQSKTTGINCYVPLIEIHYIESRYCAIFVDLLFIFDCVGWISIERYYTCILISKFCPSPNQTVIFTYVGFCINRTTENSCFPKVNATFELPIYCKKMRGLHIIHTITTISK